MILPRGESYVVRIYRGKKAAKPIEWVGTYTYAEHGGKREALKAAKAAEQAALKTRRKRTVLSVGEWVDRYLDDYRETKKDSSYSTARSALLMFKAEYGRLPLEDESFEDLDLDLWIRTHRSAIPAVVTCLNKAVERRETNLTYNPFKGRSRKSKGRKDKVPFSESDVETLAAHGLKLAGYFGPMLASLIRFAATSGMRPGELFALEWADIGFDRMRITVKRRVYRGKLRLPKNDRIREIVLTPQARDALLSVPRTSKLVFTARRGGMLSQSLLSKEWTAIANAFGERADKNGVFETVDFYELRHRCAYWMYVELGMHERLVAVQLGHTDGGKLVRELYGHGDHGALEEIDSVFADNVKPILREVEGA